RHLIVARRLELRRRRTAHEFGAEPIAFVDICTPDPHRRRAFVEQPLRRGVGRRSCRPATDDGRGNCRLLGKNAIVGDRGGGEGECCNEIECGTKGGHGWQSPGLCANAKGGYCFSIGEGGVGGHPCARAKAVIIIGAPPWLVGRMARRQCFLAYTVGIRESRQVNTLSRAPTRRWVAAEIRIPASVVRKSAARTIAGLCFRHP